MTKPNLKRIKVSSEQELRNWLAKNSGHDQQVMIVTCGKKSPEKHISSAQVREALRETDWVVVHTRASTGLPRGSITNGQERTKP